MNRVENVVTKGEIAHHVFKCRLPQMNTNESVSVKELWVYFLTSFFVYTSPQRHGTAADTHFHHSLPGRTTWTRTVGKGQSMTKSGKHCDKRRNCTFCAISSFITMFSKRCLL